MKEGSNAETDRWKDGSMDVTVPRSSEYPVGTPCHSSVSSKPTAGSSFRANRRAVGYLPDIAHLILCVPANHGG